MIREDIANYMNNSGKSIQSLSVKTKIPTNKLQGYFMGVERFKSDRLMLIMEKLGLSVGTKGEEFAEKELDKINEVVMRTMYAKGMREDRLASMVGVPVPCMSYFLNGKRTLAYDAFDKTLDILGLCVLPVKE